MTVVRSFAPWITYAIVASFSDTSWRWGAVAAVVVGLALILQDRRSGVTPDSQILEISAVIFFVVVAVIGFVAQHSDFHRYDSVCSFAWLAVTAWGSLAIGKPFTEGIAKREVPREYWGSEKFKRINRVITGAWALAFTAAALALWLIFAKDYGNVADGVVQVAAFVLPMWFTDWYKGRGAAADAEMTE
ncbi:MAG: hypothetical protein QM728_08395 [Gordonia sp. (in: high G+C Gram-positive bacteria)]|uniref:hypothetical protein n=1 Tax=Gordonia sp. (in: high G+C Gram-positive bacteria) TaxID=84139 RepID=UPI0039E38DDA